jgi:uncharacterized protein (TIRG00374 family)
MKKHFRLIGILLFVLILLNIDMKQVAETLAETSWWGIFLVALLNIVVMSLRAYRWVKLLEIQDYHLGLKESFWSYLRSFYLGSVTPGRVGELFRAHYLMKYINTDSARAVSSVVFDRILDMYFMLILGIVGLLFSDIMVSYLWVKPVFIVLMVLFPVFVLFPGITLTLTRILPNYWNIRMRSHAWLENFFDGIKCFLTWKIAFSVLLTVVIYVLFFWQCLLLAYFMNLQIDFFFLAFCVVLFSILSVLPISFSNVGTREFVLIVMFQYVGLSSASAVSYSLLFFFVINVVIAVIGWLAFIFYTDRITEEIKEQHLLDSDE